jgi:hypothetical protein
MLFCHHFVYASLSQSSHLYLNLICTFKI